MFLVDKRIPGAERALGIWYDGTHSELIAAARSIQPTKQLTWSKHVEALYVRVVLSFGAASWVWAWTHSVRMGYAAFAGGMLTLLLIASFTWLIMPWYYKKRVIRTFEAAVAKGLALATGSLAYTMLDEELQNYGFENLAELDAVHPGLVAEVMPAYVRLFCPHEARLADPNEQKDARLAMSRIAEMAAEAIVSAVNFVEYDDTVEDEDESATGDDPEPTE